MNPQNAVVLVTGASRGIGKGIAVEFAHAGATVYLTGRTRREAGAELPGSIEQTADEIRAAGGKAVAIACDHAIDADVRKVFDQIAAQVGRLDVLVNNACALPAALVGEGGFWERSLDLADMFGVGLRSTYVASCMAAPLMVRQKSGLIVNVSFYGANSYFHGPAYGAQKAGGDKMMQDMAVDLRPHRVAALSIWPGRVRTELNIQRWRGKPGADERLAQYETPEFTGRVLVSLCGHERLMDYSGHSIIAAEYAMANGICDIDGKQPPSLRHEFHESPIHAMPQGAPA